MQGALKPSPLALEPGLQRQTVENIDSRAVEMAEAVKAGNRRSVARTKNPHTDVREQRFDIFLRMPTRSFAAIRISHLVHVGPNDAD